MSAAFPRRTAQALTGERRLVLAIHWGGVQ